MFFDLYGKKIFAYGNGGGETAAPPVPPPLFYDSVWVELLCSPLFWNSYQCIKFTASIFLMLTKTRWKIEFNDSLVTPPSYNTTILKFMLVVHELKPKKNGTWLWRVDKT